MKNCFLLIAIIILFGCEKDGVEKDVLENIPKACFDYTASNYSEDSNLINFKNCSENASSYRWDFGDGQFSNDAMPLHIYKNSGSFIVFLYASGANSTDTLSKTITIPLAEMIVGISQPNAIEVDFSPLYIEYENSASSKPVILSIDGVEYLKFSKYFTLSGPTNQKRLYQKVATLSGCEICTQEFKPALYEMLHNVSVNYTFRSLNESDLLTRSGSDNFLVFKFGKDKKRYMAGLISMMIIQDWSF